MEKDERLLPLPNTASALQTPKEDYPANYSPFYDDDSIEQKRSVVEYLNIIYKRLPIILALTVITTAVVAFYMYRQPSQYEARTEMVIEPRKPKATQQTIINLGNDVNYYNTQLQLLQNMDLMREVVIRLGLYREPNLFGRQDKGFITTVRSMVSGEKEALNSQAKLPVITQTEGDAAQTETVVLSPEEKARVESYAGQLRGGLRITQVEKTNIVHIFVQSSNPELAAKVADKVADVFIEQDIERSTQGAKKNLVDLTDSIERLQGALVSQTQQLVAKQIDFGVPLTGEVGDKFSASKLEGVNSSLLKVKEERGKIEADYEAAVSANASGEIFSRLGNDPAIQAMRNNLAARKAAQAVRIEQLKIQIQDLISKRSELLVRYTEDYKDVVAIDEQIKSRQDILKTTEAENTVSIAEEERRVKADVAKEVLTGKKAELVAVRKQEAQLENAFNAELASANRTGVAGTTLMGLTREIETGQGMLNTYMQRQKELELLVSSSKPDNLIVSNRAVKPGAPIGPNRGRSILIAFLLSLSAGIGLAFLLDYLDDSVRTSDDIGRYLGLPTLALIPHQSSGEKRKLNLSGGKMGIGNMSMALVSLEDNRSAIAEAYRHLRTSLLFSSAGKPPQTILVTSSQPSEGKTTTAINTAITLAQSGASVVIIDCDLRRPRLHSHFALENGHGLTNYLSGEKDTDNLLKPFEALPKLKVITSGPIPPNPAELLSSNEMKNLLQFLKGKYQHVIIDSPPAISFTDAAILSTLVDGVILVAMAGKSSLHLMRRFKQRLGAIGARIYGVVLNGVRQNSVEYGYYGYAYTSDYYTNTDESTPLLEDVTAQQDEKT